MRDGVVTCEVVVLPGRTLTRATRADRHGEKEAEQQADSPAREPGESTYHAADRGRDPGRDRALRRRWRPRDRDGLWGEGPLRCRRLGHVGELGAITRERAANLFDPCAIEASGE